MPGKRLPQLCLYRFSDRIQLIRKLVTRGANFPLMFFHTFASGAGVIALRCSFVANAVLVRGTDKRYEQWMWIKRFGFELGVKLTTKEPWMVGKLNYLNELSIRRFPREYQPMSPKFVLVTRIEFVTVSMAFVNCWRPINPFCQRAFLKLAGVRAESHSPAHRFYSDQVAQLEDYRVRGVIIELGRVSALEATHIASEFDRRTLHSQTDTEVRRSFSTSIIYCSQHAGNTSFAKSSGHQDRIEITKTILPIRIVHQIFRLEPSNLYPKPVRNPSMDQGFVKALVGVLQLNILADYADAHCGVRFLDCLDQLGPSS